MAEPYLSIVIPAYNESLRIGKTLDAVRNYAASRPFETEIVLVNEINRGKGYSVRRGVLESRGKLILFTDADLSAPIEEADKLLAALDATGADAAIGSRALDRKLIGVHQPWRREFAGRCFNLLVRIFTGLALHDTQCGLKLFRRGSTRRAFELQRV